MSNKTQILDAKAVDRKILRLAWELYENNIEENEIFIVGIAKRGVLLSKAIAKQLEKICDIKITLGVVNLDKDHPYDNDIQINLDSSIYSNKVVVLVDDVLNSGKTLMYGAKHFLETPLKKLSIVVLIDRNHNRYPVKSDYVGLSLSTTLKEYISVELTGSDKGVYLC